MAIWDTASGKKSDEQSAMGSVPDENELISEWMHRYESKLSGMFESKQKERSRENVYTVVARMSITTLIHISLKCVIVGLYVGQG